MKSFSVNLCEYQSLNKTINLMEGSTWKLIVDSGSSHVKWALVKDASNIIKTETPGINLYFAPKEDTKEMIVQKIFPILENQPERVKEIYFYGTGLSNPKNQELLKEIFGSLFPGASLNLYTDIEGAARGLCIREKGIACIIGTGSSSCYYDGKEITDLRPGQGYILGDEASGAYLGKLLIQGFLNQSFDEEMVALFKKSFPEIDRPYILEKVYRSTGVNVFFAGFSPFYSANRGVKWIESTLAKAIKDFIEIHLLKFANHKDTPIHFTGSVALAFQSDWEKILKEYGLKPGKFEKNPIEGLLKYHLSA